MVLADQKSTRGGKFITNTKENVPRGGGGEAKGHTKQPL